MVQLRLILDNFTKLLYNRGVDVPIYRQLLEFSDEDLILFLAEDIRRASKHGNDELDYVKSQAEHHAEALTTVVETTLKCKPAKVLIYWSSTPGKTVLVSELASVDKIMENVGAQHAFIMSLFDKTIGNKRIPSNIEVFNYTDCIVDYKEQMITPMESTVYDYDDFIMENPSMQGYDLPKMYSNDLQARYVGARSGNVIQIVRNILVPMASIEQDISFRHVSRYIDKDINTPTGEFFDTY